MRFGRAEGLFRFRTLRFQLAAWNAAVILVLVLGTSLAMRQGLSWVLHRELDAQLKEDLQEVGLILDRFWPDLAAVKEELDRKAVTHKAHVWFCRVFHPDGRQALVTVGAPPVLAPADVTSRPFSFDGNRILQARRARPGEGYLIRVGCNLDSVTDDVATLTRLLVVVAAAFLLAAPLSGWLLAGRATRPLAAILETAARARPGRLDERLPARGTGDELDQLAATLNNLLDRLAAHLDRQRAFVANAAHELRSPLAALRTSAEVALGQERSAEEYCDRLADIVEACDGLVALVNQLLLLAEGEAGLARSGAPVPLDRLAARTVEMFQGVAEQRDVGLTLEAGEPVWVPGRDTHLRQVISNLVDNALKFTPPGGGVRVAVRRASEQKATLEVSDTGAGIAGEDLPHVFERFYRADRSRRREGGGGSGLGLSICQALVTAHGGEIRLDSPGPGRGTTVTVTLPACAPVPAANLTKM
jgi:heavy metal sensor kinase